MTQTRTLTRSFAGGEITPELYGRMDLTKFQTGVALCQNMLVLPHGPLAKRPGFRHVIQLKSANARLIPFSYNTEQTYIIEVGEYGGAGYMRFHSNGGTLLSATGAVISGITMTNPPVATYVGADVFVNGQWVYIGSFAGGHPIEGWAIVTNVNAAANTFQLYDLHNQPIDATGFTVPGDPGSADVIYEIASPYLVANDLSLLKYEQSADVMTLVHPAYATRTLSRTGAATFAIATVTYGSPVATPTAPTVTPNVGPLGGGTTQTKDWDYKRTAVDVAGQESLPSTSDNGVVDLDILYNYNYVAAAGAAYRYNVYRAASDGVYFFIGQCDTCVWDTNIIPDFSRTPPEAFTLLSTANYYPGAVSYHDQRKVFGGSILEPTAFYMTSTGSESNLNVRTPPLPGDRVVGRLVARQVNEIRHFVSLTDLLVFTSGAEWVVSSSDGGAITAYTVTARPQSFNGCSHIRPQVTGNSVLYADASEQRILAIEYSDTQRAYVSKDTSIMAPHLTSPTNRIKGTAYTGTSDRVLWAARDGLQDGSGVLLGLTFLPEHEVAAWHQHLVGQGVVDVAVVREGAEDVLYAAIVRTIPDRGDFTYLERLSTREFAEPKNWFGLDSGVDKQGNVLTFYGLRHLEGMTVSALVDGAVVEGLTVVNGGVTLPAEGVGVTVVGVPYVARAKSLPLSLETAGGGYGRVKAVNKAHIRVDRTGGLLAGRDADNLRPYHARTTEPYGSPPALASGEVEITLDSEWDADGSITISNASPLPMTLVSMSLEVEIGE